MEDWSELARLSPPSLLSNDEYLFRRGDRKTPSKNGWNTQSLSLWSLRLLLWPGTAVDGGVRNASKRSFTIA